MNQPRAPATDRPAANGAHPPRGSRGRFEPCQQCGAPMERISATASTAPPGAPTSPTRPRGTSRRPAAIAAGAAERTAPPGATPNGDAGAGVFFFALLPIAVAVGVLVGRSGSAPTERAARGAPRGQRRAAAGAGSGRLETHGLRDRAPEQRLLARQGLHGEARLAADRRHRSGGRRRGEERGGGQGRQGRRDHQPRRLRDQPDQGQQDYVLYSGEFEERADAEKALAALKRDFPDAEVIEVTSSAAAGGGQGPT